VKPIDRGSAATTTTCAQRTKPPAWAAGRRWPASEGMA
jgi:hypothetical protein